MCPFVDPMRTQGIWVLRTASGAIYLIDSIEHVAPVIVTRFTRGPAGDDPEYWRGPLRRDGHPIRASRVQHRTAQFYRDGIVLGADMYLRLEPLAPTAIMTLRRTTPVVQIETVAMGVPGGRRPH
jgi:hypothetical protein